MLERRSIVGGAAVTEEFHPGFRNSVASYTVSLLNPKVIRDLRLQEHGLRVVERPYSNFLPLADGQSFRLGGEHGAADIARWSQRDVAQLPKYYAMLDRVVVVLRELMQNALDEDTKTRIARYRCASATFRMNVALSELPDFAAAPGTHLQPHHQSGILIGPSLRYFEQAYFDAKSKEHNAGWARQPIVELVISSTLDDTLAPPGQHVASLFCQHVHPDVDGGWDAHRETVANLMIDTVDAWAPNFRRSVLGYQALSPLDLERTFGLIGGDIFHGALGPDQLFSARPLLGQGNYRGAIPGLYLCGSGTHPGGGVTGLPGRNAAREILRDAGRGPRPD